MAAMTMKFQLVPHVEQFYYSEARLLDERRFQKWLALVDQAIEYSMPARYVPQPDLQKQNSEDFLAIDRELDRAEGGKGSPIRYEKYMQLMVRTMRPFMANAWAESPPPRTRRFISNVEVDSLDGDECTVFSNFQLFYSHDGADNHIYTGGRRDVLKATDESFLIVKREVILDWNIITVPTVALIF